MTAYTQPTQWTHALGNNADVSTLPDDTAGTTGLASLQKLFQLINQTPLAAGGVAPSREDFNALFKLLGESVFYMQNGGVWAYNATYDYEVGRVVLHTDGNLYKCIKNNGVSSAVKAPTDLEYWTKVSTQNDLTSLLPTGSIIPFAGSNIPAGYLLCNGVAVSRTSYAALFGVISTLYGTGDGTTTFNLPDLRDRFLEGAGTNALATYLEAGLPNITGTFGGSFISFWLRSNWITNGGTADTAKDYYAMLKGAFNLVAYNTDNTVHRMISSTADSALIATNAVDFNASRSSRIFSKASTVQPSALNVQYLIKY